MDAEKHAQYVIERVAERGELEEMRAVWNYYGEARVADAVRNSRSLSSRTVWFFSSLLHAPLESFRSYTPELRNGTDVLAHQYPILEPATEIGGLCLASLPDIAAMKLNAVMRRGAKKDFWDIAAIPDCYPMAVLVDFFSRKYGHMNRFALTKSLCYFNDADSETAPILSLTGMTWPEVKLRIQEATAELLRGRRMQ